MNRDRTRNNRAAEISTLLNRLGELLSGPEEAQREQVQHQAVRPLPERVLLTVEEAAERLGIGRTTAFALVKSGEIESVLIGRLRRVSVSAVQYYAARLVANGHAHRKAA
jgi:excisionase family DNA binding protein